MAGSRGHASSRALFAPLLVLCALSGRLVPQAAHAGSGPSAPAPPPDPSLACEPLGQGAMTHVFDTRVLPGGPYYMNDHTLVQGPDGAWHLYGIFHAEPMGDDTEIDFLHAVADEPDPARWQEGAFQPAPAPHTLALRADRALGETHLWAPHVVRDGSRYLMVYQGGGRSDDHASMRLAESDDLYRWTRIGPLPLFEDFCAARDPMLVRRDTASWALYYTRCESLTHKVSGVAYRTSRDLSHWSEPHMALTLGDTPATSNSGYTESPFVFERGGSFFLTVSAYPTAWDATLVYRSPAPFAFPDTPITRLRAHAAEWVFDPRGHAFMTHSGPGQRGVWVSRVDGI